MKVHLYTQHTSMPRFYPCRAAGVPARKPRVVPHKIVVAAGGGGCCGVLVASFSIVRFSKELLGVVRETDGLLTLAFSLPVFVHFLFLLIFAVFDFVFVFVFFMVHFCFELVFFVLVISLMRLWSRLCFVFSCGAVCRAVWLVPSASGHQPHRRGHPEGERQGAHRARHGHGRLSM